MITSIHRSGTHQHRASRVRMDRPRPDWRAARGALLLTLAALLIPQPVHAAPQDDPPQQAAAEDDRPTDGPTGSYRITEWRFRSLENPGADLRSLDPEAARQLLRRELGSEPKNVENARKVFERYSFEQLEELAKNRSVMSDAHKAGLAEARRVMIRRALEVSLGEFEAKTHRVGRFELGALDSGNKGSGIASDVDQTVFLIDKATGEVVSSAEIKAYIEQFNASFESLYGYTPEHLGIESMNGADFYPDHRQAHNLLKYAAEAIRVVGDKRPNTEAYRSEGELKSQAEGRGYEALQEFGKRLVELDEGIKRLRAEWEAYPREQLTPEQAQRGRQIVSRLRAGEAAYFELIRLSPWTYVSRNAAGEIIVSTAEDPRRTKVLSVEPEMVERFAFDGSYDNWFMFENHPHNRPKYLLRSGAEGPFLLSRVRRSAGGEGGPADIVYDLTPGRKVTPYDYDTEYGRSNHELNNRVLTETYGHLDERGSGLTLDRVRQAYDAAAKFRLKHKGVPRPDGQPYDIYDVYSEYMSRDTRYPAQVRLQEAMARWEVDAREIMIENLMLTVRAPGDIMQGKFTAGELAHIARQVRTQAPNAPVQAEALRLAAELQLFNGIHDLLSPEHARELVESDPVERERIRRGRSTDLVDRLLREAGRGEGGQRFKAELERIAREAAAVRVTADLNLQKHGTAERTYVQELRAQMASRLARLEARAASVEAVAERLREGGYSREIVSEVLLEGLTRAQVVAGHYAGEGVAHALGAMGFEGKVVFPEGEVALSKLRVEFGEPAFSSRKFLSTVFSAGSIYSGLIVLETAVDTDYDPAAVAWAATREIVLRLPHVMAGTALYELVAHGRPEGASLLATMYFSPTIGHGFILVSIGVMAVRIGGKVLLAPLEKDNVNMIYQGYLAAREGGWVFDAGLREAMQSPLDFLLSPVEIRVVPFEMRGLDGEIVRHPPEQGFLTEGEGEGAPVTDWAVAPYSFEEAKNLEFVAWPDVYEWATAGKLLGGADPWEERFRLANDPVNNPELNFKAKRASLFYHYEDEVDEFLCRRGGYIEGFGPCVHDERTDNIETLVSNEGPEGAAVALMPFFLDIVNDWILRRDEFYDGDGGAASDLIDHMAPPDRPAERMALLSQLAYRMASDFLFSYRLIRDGAPGFPGEGSLEYGIQQNVRAQLTDLARWSANQSMVALEEVRANSAQPELATAIHDVIMDRRPTKGAPRIHIWPRVSNADGSTSGAGEAAAGGEDAEEPPQQVDVIISVLADPDSFPPPYEADDFEFLTSWGEGGVQLSVRVTVRDGEGKIVGEPVEKKVGILEVDEEPAVLEDPVVTACALAEDAPAEFDVADTADHCDWSADPILEYDRVALFFTPHRDLGGPDREAEPFVWQLMSPAGEAIASQFWADGEVPVQDGVPTPEASEGAPGRFVTFPDLWGPLFRQRANPLITGPGTYSVQTSPAEYYAEESLLGNASGYYEATGDWQTEGAFELGNIQLHFKDFVMEPAADRPLPERWSGAIKPAKVTVAGSRVSMELEAAWRLESDAQDDQAADSAQHRIHSRITLDFPKTIAPGRDSEFSVDTKLERLETGFGANGLPHGFAFELGLMQSTNDSPPDRHLLRGDERPEPFSTGWRSELTLAGGQRIALEGRSSTTPPMAATQEGQITFTGSGAHTFGTPARRLPWHLRDRSTIWVIPVTSHFVSFDCGRVEGCDQDNEASRSVYLTPQSIVGYAVYGSEPGPYTGPLPQGDPIPVAWVDPSPEEEVPQVAEAPGEDLADGGELPSIDVPDDVAADAPGDVPGDEAVERIDDVSNQGVVPPVLGKTRAEAEAALREHGLEPSFRTGSRAPSKAEAGTVYEQVPVAESTVIPGTSVIVTVYDDWTALVPSVTGETEAAARSRLRDDDLEAQARTGDPAPPGVRAGTVYRQIPAVGSEVEPGTTVHITVYGEALATVPRLVAISESAARRALHDAGLEMRTRTGSAARSAGEAETVYEQIPAAGSTVPPGSTVTVTVYGAYVDRRPPPQEPPRRDPLPAEPVRPEPAEPEGPSLGGRWTTPGGETVQFVRRRDGTLSAAYARGNNGRMIVVDFDGRFLNLIWAKDNYVNSPRPYCDRNMDGVSYWGEMRLEWDPSKNWFHGRYNYCGDPARGQGGGVWYLRRAGP